MEKNTWLKLYRSLSTNPIWQDKPFARGQAWVDLLLEAKWCDHDELENGRIVHRERGKVYFSVSKLADRWGWSTKKTRNFLKLLEMQGMLSLQGQPDGTIATIANWDSYQSADVR